MEVLAEYEKENNIPREQSKLDDWSEETQDASSHATYQGNGEIGGSFICVFFSINVKWCFDEAL